MTPALRLLLVILAAAWLGSLTVRPLYKPDEARYAEIAREMVHSGDWVTPRLNGFKYFEKPPLQYWATAVFFKLFGEHDWTARLWTALLALAGAAAAFHAGNRLAGPPAGIIAAGFLAASPLYLLYGQFNTLDMGVSIFLSIAIFAFALSQQRGERHWMWIGWAACAAAVLSKGLIGVVLPMTAVALYVVVTRQWRLLARLELVRGGLLFLALTAPWFIAVSAANKEFAYFFFVQEHLLRFTTTMHQRSQPAWYFVPILAVGIAPWLFLALAALTRALRFQRTAEFSPHLFLALWCVVVFVFFSASGSKLPGYILPLFPALAVLAASFALRKGMLVAQALFIAAIGVAIVLGSSYLPRFGGPQMDAFSRAYVPTLLAAAAIVVGTGLTATALAWRARPLPATAAIAVGMYAAALVAIAGHRVYAPAYTVAPTLAAVKPPPSADARFYAVDSYDHTLPWTLRRIVTMVGYKDEFGQAVSWEPGKFIPEVAGFAQRWKDERDAYAFFSARDYDRLRKELGVPMQEVARGPRYVIVRKP